MLIVSCPKCRHRMKYQPMKKDLLTTKTKRCVYCGRSFKVHSNMMKSRIMEILE